MKRLLLCCSFIASALLAENQYAFMMSVSAYQLNAVMGQDLCSRWNTFSNLACNSAAGRDCRQLGGSGGVLQEYDESCGRAQEVCLDGAVVMVASFGELKQVMGGQPLCSGTDWYPAKTLYCNSAASRFCQRRGYQGGMLQEHDGYHQNALVLCARGNVLTAQNYLLNRLNPYCTNDWGNPFNPMACASAASRFCKQRGFSGGVIQEYDSIQTHSSKVLCL